MHAEHLGELSPGNHFHETLARTKRDRSCVVGEVENARNHVDIRRLALLGEANPGNLGMHLQHMRNSFEAQAGGATQAFTPATWPICVAALLSINPPVTSPAANTAGFDVRQAELTVIPVGVEPTPADASPSVSKCGRRESATTTTALGTASSPAG